VSRAFNHEPRKHVLLLCRQLRAKAFDFLDRTLVPAICRGRLVSLNERHRRRGRSRRGVSSFGLCGAFRPNSNGNKQTQDKGARFHDVEELQPVCLLQTAKSQKPERTGHDEPPDQSKIKACPWADLRGEDGSEWVVLDFRRVGNRADLPDQSAHPEQRDDAPGTNAQRHRNKPLASKGYKGKENGAHDRYAQHDLAIA